jgi:GDP-D-mannose 3', 5'-epimerase
LHLDLRSLDNCLLATKSCDWFFNLAADMGGMGYIQSNNSVILFNNTMISFNMIESARRNHVRRFFYASSACVYPEHIQAEENTVVLREEQAWPAKPQDAYGLEKLVSEEIAIHYAKDFQTMRTRIARFHNIYGPHGQWKGGREKVPAAFCRKVLVAHEGENRGVVNVWGNGKQTRSFFYIDDCIDGIMRLMQSDYALPLNIGSDETISMNDMVRLICAIENVDVTLNHIRGPEGVRGRNSDNALIKKVLNWEPSTKLNQGLISTYRFIKCELEIEKSNGIDISTYATSKIVSQTAEILEAIGHVTSDDVNRICMQ